MNAPIFPTGIGVALITPFQENGSIDFNSLEKMIEHVIAGGVDYIVSLGTTGESVALSESECKEVLAFTIKTTKERIPIVAGCFGGNNTQQLIERVSRYNFDGISAILSSSPAYLKPTQEGIFQHYSVLEKHAPVPIILYNVPSRTSSNMNAETCIRLANLSEKFIAVKDASGDMLQAAHILRNAPDHFSLLSGDDPSCISLMAIGGHGIISVIGNVFPEAFSKMTHHALNGEFPQARKIHLELIDLHHWLYQDGNPVGIKAACNLLGLCKNNLRLPLVKISKSTLIGLENELSKIDQLN